MGSSDSESGSDSGRSERSHKKDKSHKKEKKEKKDKGSGDEKKKDKKDKDKKDKDKKDKKDDKDKDKKDKKDDKDKKDKKDDKHKTESKPGGQIPTQIAHVLSGTALGGLAQEFLQGGSGHGGGLLREGGGPGGPGGPPTIPSNPATGPGTGASGQRIPVSTTDPFPAQAAGPAPPFVDSTGQPVYVGSALVDGANVQPCRVTPSGVFIASNGVEAPHSGRYDLLPLTDAMEWVSASGGTPPAGKRLVEGGIENGSPLYHAAARVNSVLVPGKAGPGLGGAQIPANGAANFFAQDYYVLCWKE